jgi:NAD-dependent SIR2 family protein deacetylase
MALGAMGKIIVHKCKQTFNFSHQIQTIQNLDNPVCAMCHTMHTTHEWNMVLHQLYGDTIFEALKNCHSIYSKVNQLVCHIYFNNAYKFNKILHNKLNQIIKSYTIQNLL